MMFLKSAVLFALLTTVLSCSCFQEDFEDRVCRSTLVVRARVVATFDNCPGTCDPIEDQGSGKITYIVRVARTFLGKKPEDNILFLETEVNEALCGIGLNVGTAYLFTLSGPNIALARPGAPVKPPTCPVASLGVNLCQFPTPFKSLKREERSFLYRTSRNGCPK